MQRTGPGLAAVGAERRLAIWFAIYAIALCGLVFFVGGWFVETILLILISEVLFLSLRPKPGFGASTYRPPAPERWQSTITAFRWAGLLSSASAGGAASASALRSFAPLPTLFISSVALIADAGAHRALRNGSSFVRAAHQS